eukprot:1193385-Prorocentrum_minimum.AAC.3
MSNRRRIQSHHSSAHTHAGELVDYMIAGSITCSAMSSMLRPAERATTWNLSGCSSTMSKVWVPIEPVEPSREIFFTTPLPSLGMSRGTSTRPGQHAP